MTKSWGNAKKLVFCSGIYFWHFRPEKNVSQKSDSAIFWALLIRVFVQKIRKNKWWNLEKMPKNRFSGIFPALSARKKDFRKSVSLIFQIIAILHQCAKFHGKIKSAVQLTNEPCLMVGIVISDVFKWKKQRNIRKKWTKSVKTAISGIFPGFSAGKRIFLKNRSRPCFEDC